MPESNELQSARQLLRLFGQNSQKPEGVKALAEALAMISYLRENADEERERGIADNLFNTYAQKAEEQAQTILADLDSIQDDELEHWHDVMNEFVEESTALPATFVEKKNELIASLLKRIIQSMSPNEKQRFLGNLRRS